MNKVKKFVNEILGEVRYFEVEGKAWFMLRDITDVLEIGNPSAVASTIRDENKRKESIKIEKNGKDGNTVNQVVEATFVDETGMWLAVTHSRKPVAREFVYWLCDEVLPSIRKHGGYIAGQEELEGEDKVAVTEAVESLSAEVERLTKGKEKISKYLSWTEDRLFKAQEQALKTEKELENIPKEVRYYYRNPNGVVDVKVSYKIPKEKTPEPKFKPKYVVLSNGLVTTYEMFLSGR